MNSNDSELFFGEQSAVFLRRLLWLLIALDGVLTLQSLWVFPSQWDRLLDKAGIAAVSLIGLDCLRRFGLLATLKWVLWSIWVIISLEITQRRGLHNSAVLAYPLFVMLAGWLLGRRHAMLMTLATTVLALGLGLGEVQGYIADDAESNTMVLMAVLVAVLLIGTLISVNVSDHIRSHHQRAVDLAHTLEVRVAERTAHLERTNRELATALQTVQRAQHELVQSEKLASLGSLVAGVAHELNTPIGNAVTAASTLQHSVEVFAQRAAAKTMQRSTLDEFLTLTTELADLLLRSTQRAAGLISSFKRVAVDRASEQRRRFDVRVAVEELLSTLRPTLRRTPWTVVLEVDPGIEVDSYPGPLEQVLTNLVLNASNHAFEGRSAGTITVRAQPFTQVQPGDHRPQPWVRLQVVDDGNGVPADIVSRIFEPFFTTRLGRGGSGLGLSISLNIVGSVLGGTMAVDAAPGGGAVFTVQIPCTAPLAPEDEQRA